MTTEVQQEINEVKQNTKIQNKIVNFVESNT